MERTMSGYAVIHDGSGWTEGWSAFHLALGPARVEWSRFGKARISLLWASVFQHTDVRVFCSRGETTVGVQPKCIVSMLPSLDLR